MVVTLCVLAQYGMYRRIVVLEDGVTIRNNAYTERTVRVKMTYLGELIKLTKIASTR